MQAIDFNDGWSYRHLDADESFTAVRLPHDAMIGKPRHEDAPGGVNTGWFDGRDYEYVKTYAPGPELAGRRLLLEFEGVYHNAEVWVDGVQLAFRPYGYTNFRVDVTDALAAGEPHEIRVVARNADQPNSRWYSGAGIYRPVTLWAGDAGHILPDGIMVRTVSATPLPADGPADAVKADAVIETSVETTASGAVAIDIIDASGAVVANAQAVTRDIQPTGRGGEADVVPQGALAAALDAGANAVAVARIEVPDAALWDCDHPTCTVASCGSPVTTVPAMNRRRHSAYARWPGATTACCSMVVASSSRARASTTTTACSAPARTRTPSNARCGCSGPADTTRSVRRTTRAPARCSTCATGSACW